MTVVVEGIGVIPLLFSFLGSIGGSRNKSKMVDVHIQD